MDDLLESYKKAIINTFNSQYADLSSALRGCMTKFSEEAFAASLITASVMRGEKFADIANSFTTGLKLRNTAEEVQTHCECLVRILEDLGGPAAIAGRNLVASLSTLDLQYSMSLVMSLVDVSTLICIVGINKINFCLITKIEVQTLLEIQLEIVIDTLN